VPWTLHYWLTSPERFEEHRRERELFEHHPDVERVVDRTDLHTILEVWFEDELFRTDEPALLAIHKFRRRSRVDLREVDLGDIAKGQPPATTDPRFRAPVIDAEFVEEPPPGVPDDVRQRLVQQALGDPEYRRRLALGFAAPLRRSIDYQSIARRTFLVEQLPDGALPVYDRDPPAPPVMDQGQTGSAVAHAPLPGVVMTDYSTVHGYDPGPTPSGAPIRNGHGAYIQQLGHPLALVSGLNGMGPDSVGRHLEISGSPNHENNGVFVIVRVDNMSSVWIHNPNARYDYYPGLTWNLYNEPWAIRHEVGYEHAPDLTFMEISHVHNPPDPRAVIQPTTPVEHLDELIRLQRAGVVDIQTIIQQMLPPGEVVGVPEGWLKIDIEEIPKESEHRRTGFARVLEDGFLEND
jgi:hypothetical protein